MPIEKQDRSVTVHRSFFLQQLFRLAIIFHIFFILLVITPLIVQSIRKHVVLRNAQDQEQPEQVDGLQASQQGEGDVLADPALVLLSLPVEVEGPDSAELCECRVENVQAEIMAGINPDAYEKGKVGFDNERVKVIERLGRLQHGYEWGFPARGDRGHLQLGRNR